MAHHHLHRQRCDVPDVLGLRAGHGNAFSTAASRGIWNTYEQNDAYLPGEGDPCGGMLERGQLVLLEQDPPMTGERFYLQCHRINTREGEEHYWSSPPVRESVGKWAPVARPRISGAFQNGKS